MLSLYTYIGSGGPPAPQIDYTPQLQEVLKQLTEVIANIAQHDANTGESHAQIIQKLQNLLDIGGAIKTLAEKNNATQEQVLATINQIADSMGMVKETITNFQSAALDKIESLAGLLQREFDQTQASIESLKQAVTDLLAPKSKELKERRVTVVSGATGRVIVVPRGANEISAYAIGEPSEFIAIQNGDRTSYAAGELYLHDWVACGNTFFTYPETRFEIPAGKRFQVSWKAETDIGQIQVFDLETGATTDPVLDAKILIPSVLEEDDLLEGKSTKRRKVE